MEHKARNHGKGGNDEKRSSSLIRGPVAPPRSNLPRLNPYQTCTQQLEQPIVDSYNAFQEVAGYAISVECSVNEERNAETHLFHELEQLALGRSGVAKEEDIDITSQPHPVRELFSGPSEQQASDRLLYVCAATEKNL